MRDLLVVSYHFLPVHNVAVKQLAKYCKYLPEFGWRPVVLTNDWSRGPAARDAGWALTVEPERMRELPATVEVRTVAHGERDNPLIRAHQWLSEASAEGGAVRRHGLGTVRRALSLVWPLYGLYPDAFAGWMAPAAEVGVTLVRGGGAAAILSQSPPEVNHVVASRIARRTGVPWFAIMGDLFRSYEGQGNMHGEGVRGMLTRRLQRWWLRPAAGAFAVSPRMVRELSATYGLPGDVVVVGFDPPEFEPAATCGGGKFRMAHVGSLYLGDQRPELFLDALDLLLARRPEAARDLEVRFVGSRAEAGVAALVAGRRCAPLVRVEPKVLSTEAVRIQQESDVLLLFDLTIARGTGGTLSYPSKVFEYLGARRPILSVPGDGDWVDRILADTRAGVVARNVEEAAVQLERWYAEWRAAGTVRWSGDEAAADAFTHRRQAERMAARLDAAVDARGPRAAARS